MVSPRESLRSFGLFTAEVVLLLLFFMQFGVLVTGGVGENVTVTTLLNVGTVAPEILNISVYEYNTDLTLIANDSVLVGCVAIVQDYNNDTDIANASAFFYDASVGAFDPDDNNTHYTNSSCVVNTDFEDWHGAVNDSYTALVNCTFAVQYYSNPGEWICNMTVNDTAQLTDQDTDNISINELLAIGVPDQINYGTVNSTYVSSQQTVNVTNFGNVELNLSLDGYGSTEGDGLAMNCTLGSSKNISVDYEKYNLTTSTTGALTLSEFEGNYTNLTSSAVVKEFNLPFRQNEGVNDATNETYWRIYVPLGVAGSCEGNIIFGGVKAAE